MPITYEASGHTSIPTPSSPSSWTFTPDAGTQAGDIFIVSVFAQDNSVTISAGSNQAVVFAINTDFGPGDRFSLLRYVSQQAGTHTVTVPISATAQGTISWARFRGVDTANPIDVFSNSGVSFSPTVVAPSITTTGPDRYIMGGWTGDGGSSVAAVTINTWATTLNGTITPRKGALALKGVQANAGASGASPTWVTSPTTDWAGGRVVWQLALRPSIAAPPTPSIEWAISGGLTANTAKVNARIIDGPPGQLQVSTSSNMSSPTSFVGTLTADNVYTFSITGLTANTVYHYGLAGVRYGQFKTFPNGVANFTIAAGSCNSTGSNTALWDLVGARNPSLFLHMGDFGYEDIATNDPGLYRAGHKANLGAARQKALFASVPLAYVWDDHDFGPNNSDGTHVGKPAAQQVYREYFPHWPLPADTRPGGAGEIYQTYVIGRVRFVLLDGKSNRTPEGATDGPSKTTLGADQKAWLKETLLAATEPVIVLEVSEPWIGTDGWGMYATERAEIGQFLHDNDLISRVILLHGDAHMLAADDGTNTNYSNGGGPGPMLFCFAPLDRSNSVKGGPYTAGTFTGSQTQYGTLDFADDGAQVTVTGRGWQVTGATETQMFQMQRVYGDAPPASITGSLLTTPAGRWVKGVLRPVFHDGAWRAVLPTTEGHRLDTLVAGGTIPGVIVDTRQAARVTAVRQAGQTYLLSGHPTESRLTVLNGDTTVRSSTVPLVTSDNDAAPITLARDTSGHLWAAGFTTAGQVRVTRSTDDGATWQPVQTVATVGTTTGLVSIVETSATLVMVATANDGAGRSAFTLPVGSGSYATWATEALPALPAGVTSDDHLSVVAVYGGRVLVVTKTTGATTTAHPLLQSMTRSAAGEWSALIIEPGPDDIGARYTRPAVTVAGSLAVATYGSINAPGDLMSRTLDLTDPGAGWSEPVVVWTGPGWSDSAAVPDSPPFASWPAVAHNRDTGGLTVRWVTSWADVPELDHPMYVGTRRVVEIRVGSALAFQ